MLGRRPRDRSIQAWMKLKLVRGPSGTRPTPARIAERHAKQVLQGSGGTAPSGIQGRSSGRGLGCEAPGKCSLFGL